MESGFSLNVIKSDTFAFESDFVKSINTFGYPCEVDVIEREEYESFTNFTAVISYTLNKQDMIKLIRELQSSQDFNLHSWQLFEGNEFLLHDGSDVNDIKNWLNN